MGSKVDFSGYSDDVIGAFVSNFGNDTIFVLTKIEHDDGSFVGHKRSLDPYHVDMKYWDYIPRQWDGKGLPPVGTICEYFWTEGDAWRECEVVAHYKSEAVVCDSEGDVLDRVSEENLRPLKTQEQKAAEEREAAVKAMAGVISRAHGKNSLYALYDAGYRLVK